MKIKVEKQNLETVKTDFLVVNMFANEKKPGNGTGVVDRKLKGLITQKIKKLNFKGKSAGEYFIFDNPFNFGAKQIMVISLGDRKNFYFDVVRTVAAISLLEAKKQKAKTMATILHGAGNGNLEPSMCAQSMTEGFLLANYKFDKYKKEKNKNSIKEIIICQKKPNNLKIIKSGIILGQTKAQAQIFTRNLVNEPPRHMYPKTLKQIAEEITKKSNIISAKIYNRKQIELMNMNSFLAVDEGSDKDPYFIHLIYKPRKKTKKKIALVGKSITFDSGGLSLKPSKAMETMKMDMGGGAVVLGIFSVLNKLQPEIEIHGILPACENMPSGRAMKVDDVVKASNGKTIEIVNTDAEGRMALADALVYAENLKPDYIIDLATLTGAAVVALGNNISALMTNNEYLKNTLLTASKTTDEKIWELPLEKSYESHIKSEIADIKNVGKSGGVAGTISAGLFLKEFINKTPWAHLDIAGPAWNETKNPLNNQIGGSGFGVRLLLEYINLINK